MLCPIHVVRVSLPCELFVELSDAIIAASPFAHTALSTLAGGYNGYIPSAAAFDRAGGYETKFLTSSFLAPEAGKMVIDACAELFRTMPPYVINTVE